ncbi:TetR/AcrR family transcriptional regulator [Paenibacillus donghaensis]|uniref:TetR family transcriptional regulator n=1 Tax=Paenibacillus donghaensis TaxID=414771 RepID=A0A2Z2KMX8_9BACL|nr:TetR/AcrR family transcriptional regulator [Paenibacillus donghaensis]ASA24883.1 TetR family transcriptional regulator [Paenibacillus donghaensis]
MANARSTTKEAKHNAILDAATELLVEKPAASLNEIANYAGIGIATLHRYVESREQLMLQLGLRAVQVVGEVMSRIPVDEEGNETYIPELVEALIPLGDKIYYLAHDTSLNYSQEMLAAEAKLKEPVQQMIESLQRKGYFRQDMSSQWILNVLYSLLFVTWQQIQEGHIAKKSAAGLVLETLYNGFKGGHS